MGHLVNTKLENLAGNRMSFNCLTWVSLKNVVARSIVLHYLGLFEEHGKGSVVNLHNLCLFKEHDKRGEVVLHHLGLFEDHGKGWKVVLHNLCLFEEHGKRGEVVLHNLSPFAMFFKETQVM